MLALPTTLIVPNAITPETEGRVMFAFPTVVTVPNAVVNEPREDRSTTAFAITVGGLIASVPCIPTNVIFALPTILTVPIALSKAGTKELLINIPVPYTSVP